MLKGLSSKAGQLGLSLRWWMGLKYKGVEHDGTV